jgi:hypothetical protein
MFKSLFYSCLLLLCSLAQNLSAQKDLSLGLSLPFPTGLNNGFYYPEGSSFNPHEYRDLDRFSYGNLDPGLSLSYKGFTLNFYWRYQYGGQATAEGGYPVQYPYRHRSQYYNYPSKLHDPFIMQRDGFMYFNLGYQYIFNKQDTLDKVRPLVGAFVGYNNLEIATGLDFKHGRVMLYSQLVPTTGYDSQFLFQGDIHIQGGIRTQIKLF